MPCTVEGQASENLLSRSFTESQGPHSPSCTLLQQDGPPWPHSFVYCSGVPIPSPPPIFSFSPSGQSFSHNLAENLLRLVIGAGQRKALSSPGSQPRASMNKGGRAGQSLSCQEEVSNRDCRGHSGSLAGLHNPRLLVEKRSEIAPPISAMAGTRSRSTHGTLGWSPGEPTHSTQGPLPISAELSKTSQDSRTFHPRPLNQSSNC